MSRIDEALDGLMAIEDRTQRAFEVAGLISTLFKLRGVVLVLTGEMAFSSYANVAPKYPELELAPVTGKLPPRLVQEIMGGQLRGDGAIGRWKVAEIPVMFHNMFDLARRHLCRDFNTDHGVVKLLPAEEITAERILAAVFPQANPVAHQEALSLLVNALTEAFHMNWTTLQELCHDPAYRVGDELAALRGEAKREADDLGLLKDPVGGAASNLASPGVAAL